MIGSLARVDDFRVLEVDGDGIISRLSDQGLRFGLQVGRHYASQINTFWDAIGLERFRRHLRAAKQGHVIHDRHITLDQRDGSLVLHRGLVFRRPGVGITQICQHLPLGPRPMLQTLGAEVGPTIMALGQESLTCVVNLDGLVIWWPQLLATLTGYHDVLGRPAPIFFPDGSPVTPFTVLDVPYHGVSVTCGRMGAADLTGHWIGTQAQEWTLERRQAQILVGVERRRPLSRAPGRVIKLPLDSKAVR